MALLLVAQSARMLAQSATRAGINACAIDHFADVDTRRHATHSLALAPGPHGFDATELLEAANRLMPRTQASGLVYGSGIDIRPRLVEALARGRTLLGNPPATLARVHNPQVFFRLLDTLSIPHPETRFSPPDRPDGWLVKPGCGEGGKGVGFAAKNRPAPKDAYFQRHVQGEALSVLFLADGKAIRTVGCNTQWTASHDPGQPFLFAGAVNRAELSDAQASEIEGYAAKLTPALSLVGLNSLDFIHDGEMCRVLEVNPRPSATMALYDEDFATGLLAGHIAACRGGLPPRSQRPGPVRALRIVYAPQAVMIPQAFRWPDGCADLPNPGATIKAGEPLCSLMAHGGGRREVEALLKARETELLRGLPQTGQATGPAAP